MCPPDRQTRASSLAVTFGPRRKHGAEHTDHEVKCAGLIWKMFGVAFVEFDIHFFQSRACASLVQQIGRDVDPDDDRTRLRCGNGEVAVSASDVQHPNIRLELPAIDKFIGYVFGDPGDPRIIAGHPGRLDPGFQRLGIDSLLDGHGLIPSHLPLLAVGHLLTDFRRMAVGQPLRQSAARLDYPFCAVNRRFRIDRACIARVTVV
jgi:hypothetical protein